MLMGKLLYSCKWTATTAILKMISAALDLQLARYSTFLTSKSENVDLNKFHNFCFHYYYIPHLSSN